jgi:hypothetical protein
MRVLDVNGRPVGDPVMAKDVTFNEVTHLAERSTIRDSGMPKRRFSTNSRFD